MLQKSIVDTTALKKEINLSIAEIEEMDIGDRPTAISQLIRKMPPLDSVETDAYADLLNQKFGTKKRSFDSVLRQARGELRLEHQQRAIEQKVAQFSGDNAEIIQEIETAQLRKNIPDFRPGDTVKVHIRIIEGAKERVQIFQGVVIKRKRGTMGASFTVRKISNGVGVEKTIPMHSPRIEKVEVVSRGRVRRSRLYYLRNLRGKAARIRDRDIR